VSGIETVGRFTGQVFAEYDHPDLRRWLGRLPEVHGLEPISEGRDSVYRAEAPTALGRQVLAVKRFGREPAWKNRIDRLRGPRAASISRNGIRLRRASRRLKSPIFSAPKPSPICANVMCFLSNSVAAKS
jgi:hypothetical protein